MPHNIVVASRQQLVLMHRTDGGRGAIGESSIAGTFERPELRPKKHIEHSQSNHLLGFKTFDHLCLPLLFLNSTKHFFLCASSCEQVPWE